MPLSLKLNGNDSKNEPREKDTVKEPKRYTVTFSLAGLVSLSVLTLVALSWIFILGVLVGRGYKPEKAVPELERIMPQAEEQAPATPEVIKPEELNFYSELSRKPEEAQESRPEKPAVKKAPERPAPVKPEPVRETAKPAPAPEQKPVHVVTPAEESYRYAYQVASLKDLKAARQFQDKLARAGLSSRIEKADAKGTTWHRVIVSFQGTPEDTRDLKAKLGQLGIEKPLLKEKTLVKAR
ncbi:cell division protein FtsN [Desulfobaculum xiamenense]|uniref:Cell division protein FtsN n=1 Tax=Desulfobaculum xiamenense TaxID=995050 RepID=A0A846QUZ6_9BACT|nr:SPOR domain-containing protein [Desulfobaculum xiamenense]NJB69375.1 cell division protein FtsN [Desulfobaculum xiamenense]